MRAFAIKGPDGVIRLPKTANEVFIHPDDAAKGYRCVEVEIREVGEAGEQPAQCLQLPPLTDVMYHAVRGSEYHFTGGGESMVAGYLDDDCLDEIWDNINTALRCSQAAQPAEPAMVMTGVVADVLREVEKAVKKFPTWPTDPLHALAVLGEEFGELTKAVLQTTYEPHKVKDGEVRSEAIQTAAMALRFLQSLDVYEARQCEQHQQAPLSAAKERDDKS